MKVFGMCATAALLAVSTPALAATTVVDGKCSSVTSSTGCLFNGGINASAVGLNSYTNAQAAYNLYNNGHAGTADITLTVIGASDDANFASWGSLSGSAAGGSWTVNGYLVDFYAVQAGPNFVLYQLGTPASSGAWSTVDIPHGKFPREAAHLVFFGTVVPAVPEAASWAMMIVGFGMIGLALRKRRRGNAGLPRTVSRS